MKCYSLIPYWAQAFLEIYLWKQQELGFEIIVQGKGMYVAGHEREDVVKYRGGGGGGGGLFKHNVIPGLPY